jgi:hypothetical protein
VCTCNNGAKTVTQMFSDRLIVLSINQAVTSGGNITTVESRRQVNWREQCHSFVIERPQIRFSEVKPTIVTEVFHGFPQSLLASARIIHAKASSLQPFSIHYLFKLSFIVTSINRAIIALMMEAVSHSETSANFYQTTWRNIPEECHLHNRRCEDLKCHHVDYVLDCNAVWTCRYIPTFRRNILLPSAMLVPLMMCLYTNVSKPK